MKGKLIIWDESIEDSPIKELVLNARALEIIKDYMEVAHEWFEDSIEDIGCLPDDHPEKQEIPALEQGLVEINNVLKLLGEA